mmetsp:Transcript_9596/g.19302  ORF Transcript_9596/g.19302 Transcript_9596/m.19302 type:complete len:428 (+) Transcript_9596:140-1423(+)
MIIYRLQHLLFLLFPSGLHSFNTNNICCISRIRSHRPALHHSFIPSSSFHHYHRLSLHCRSSATATTTMSASTQSYATLSKSLMDDIVDATEPTSERAIDILSALSKEQQPITIEILENTKLGKVLVKVVKTCKRHKRTSSTTDNQWDEAISTAEKLLVEYKAAADAEAKAASKKKVKSNVAAAQKPGLPSSTSAYKTRLVTQKKEMYKDPPALPPAHITIESKLVKEPKRNKTTGELTFVAGENKDIAKVLKDFHPNRTPEEVLRAGSFGGTYFRPISSAVTNVHYNPAAVLKDTVQSSWIDGLNKSTMLTSIKYNTSINKYKVKCGGSLGMWESSGWIADSDPYGWFQWYCRFYSGRRCSDDARQISRWCKSAGLKGRFRSQICNKIIAANTTCDDAKISPVIRQTLLHWGLEITEDVVEKHRNR